jgi:ketosteroid isomerase-like protein
VSVQDELDDFNDRFHKAIASGDVASIVAHFDPNGQLIAPGEVVQGTEALAAHFATLLANGFVGMKSSTTQQVYHDGSLVIEIGTAVASSRTNGSDFDLPLKAVGVLRRTDQGLRLLVDCVVPASVPNT